jgi:SAM-dependent methyltransferase
MENATSYWNERARLGPDAAVIDPFDRRGYKTRYIRQVRNQAILESLRLLPTGSKLLDFGCGPGNLSIELAQQGFWPAGVDIARNLLRQTKRHAFAQPHLFVQYDGTSVPFATHSFDGCVTYLVMIYLTDDAHLDAILRELWRVLKPGGTLVAVEQTRRRARKTDGGVKLQRTVDEYLRHFEGAGFTGDQPRVVRRGHFPFLYPIRYGIVRPSLFPALIGLEAWLGRRLRHPRWDYAETAFSFRKK